MSNNGNVTSLDEARKARPATQAERDALQFEPVKIDFHFGNQEWTDTYLSNVRLSVILLEMDEAELTEKISRIVAGGMAHGFLDNLTLTKQHLEDLAGLVNCTLTRSFLVLERLGYSPDNPPPHRVA